MPLNFVQATNIILGLAGDLVPALLSDCTACKLGLGPYNPKGMLFIKRGDTDGQSFIWKLIVIASIQSKKH